MMAVLPELLPGVLHIPLKSFTDHRGRFVKTDLAALLGPLGIPFEPKDEYYSVSARDTIRGMHFQIPPHDHAKIVYCPAGAALDVLLDLRTGLTYGQVASVVLRAEAPALVFIPKGIAHGFRALQDDTLMIYKTTSAHEPASDAGIHFASFGFDWGCAEPILSERDRNHPPLDQFHTPFRKP